MSHTIHFIPATEHDVMQMLELRRQIWATTYRGIYPDAMIDEFDYAWHKEKELQRIRNPQYAVYFIANDKGNIGYLSIHNTDIVRMLSLYIVKEYQHQGIGRQAFDFVAKHCSNNNADSFTCSCVPENWNARYFYEKMGGKIVKEDLDNEESWMNSVVFQFDVRRQI